MRPDGLRSQISARQQPPKATSRSVLIGVTAGVAALVVIGGGAFFFLRPRNAPASGRVPPRGWVKQGDLKKIMKPGNYGNCVFSSKEIAATDDDSAVQTTFASGDPIFSRCFFPKRVGQNKQGEIWQELWIDGVKRAQVMYDAMPTDEESIPIALSQQQAQRLQDLSGGKHTLDVWIYRQAEDADAPTPLAAGELIVRK
jgi:hypothetical protein